MEVIVKKIQEDVFVGRALIVETDKLTIGGTITGIHSMLRPSDNSVKCFFTMRLKQGELACKGTFLSFDKINEEEDFSQIKRGTKTIDEYLRLIVTLIQAHSMYPEKKIFKEDGNKNMFIISMFDNSLQRHVLIFEINESGWYMNHDSWSWDGAALNAEKRFLAKQEIGTRFFFVQAPGF